MCTEILGNINKNYIEMIVNVNVCIASKLLLVFPIVSSVIFDNNKISISFFDGNCNDLKSGTFLIEYKIY